MDQLVDNLLSIARHGQPPEETEALDLADVATDAWQTVATPEVDLEIDAEREVEAEAARLRELLENLFRNAAEHAVAEGGTATVRIEAEPNGFAVADDGVGIPPDEREAVFERGYSTDDQGTGFGLAIVEEIAEAHDWTVEVTESEAGGAKFVVETE
jgi:signal transduction histidine kinase